MTNAYMIARINDYGLDTIADWLEAYAPGARLDAVAENAEWTAQEARETGADIVIHLAPAETLDRQPHTLHMRAEHFDWSAE